MQTGGAHAPPVAVEGFLLRARMMYAVLTALFLSP